MLVLTIELSYYVHGTNKITTEKIRVSLKPDKNNGYFT